MTTRVPISPNRVCIALGLIAGVLVLLSTAGQVGRFAFGHPYMKGFVPLFFVDYERNIPTFFTVLLLLAAALLASFAYAHARTLNSAYRFHWIGLSVGFLYIAYDEAFQLHERLIRPMRNMLGGEDLGIFYFAWVVPAMVFLVAFALVYLPFLVHLPRPTRRALFFSAALYLSGSLGCELIGGYLAERNGTENPAYSAVVTVEEGLEMAGLIAFVRALLSHLGHACGEIRIAFSDASPQGSATLR